MKKENKNIKETGEKYFLEEWRKKIRLEVISEILELKPKEYKIGHILPCKMCSPKCGFNSALSQWELKIKALTL